MDYRALVGCTAATLVLLTGCTDRQPAATAPTPSAGTTTTTPPPTVATTPPATVDPTPSTDELSPKPGLETAAPLGQPACKGTDLTVTDADTLMDASYRQQVFSLRTKGPDCQLKGYPTVKIDGITTQRGGYGLPPEQPETVTLSRSTSLSFMISSARSGTCRDVPTISVTLPGTTTAHRVSTSMRVCGSRVGVSPVHRQGDAH